MRVKEDWNRTLHDDSRTDPEVCIQTIVDSKRVCVCVCVCRWVDLCRPRRLSTPLCSAQRVCHRLFNQEYRRYFPSRKQGTHTQTHTHRCRCCSLFFLHLQEFQMPHDIVESKDGVFVGDVDNKLVFKFSSESKQRCVTGWFGCSLIGWRMLSCVFALSI